MSRIKPGGLLARAMAKRDGACETCWNLVQVSKSALGCAAHDKLIMPEYPPYHGNAKCKDWEERRRDSDAKGD